MNNKIGGKTDSFDALSRRAKNAILNILYLEINNKNGLLSKHDRYSCRLPNCGISTLNELKTFLEENKCEIKKIEARENLKDVNERKSFQEKMNFYHEYYGAEEARRFANKYLEVMSK